MPLPEDLDDALDVLKRAHGRLVPYEDAICIAIQSDPSMSSKARDIDAMMRAVENVLRAATRPE